MWGDQIVGVDGRRYCGVPRVAVVGVLVAGIWAPIVIAPALVASGLILLVGAASPAVGAIIAMMMGALVLSWIITHGVVYN